MDDEEAEQAAAPAALSINGDVQEAAKDDSVSGNTPPAMDNAGVGKRPETVPGNPDCIDAENLAEESVREQPDACSVSQVPKVVDKEPAVIKTAAEEMDAEAAPAKRRHEDVVAARRCHPRGDTLQDTLCPNVPQNIMVASTPNQENVSRYVSIRQIVVQGKEHEVSAYVTAPHSTCKGVIRGIPLQDSPNTINAKIVNERNPLALMAKRIAQTGMVIVAFDGYKVPNLVKYGSILLRCTLYRKQIDVCYGCGRLGHRMDVCPSPGEAVTGGQHLTASKDSAQRFQIPYVVRRRRGERAREGAARSESAASLASEDHSQCPPVDNDATGRRARGRSASKSNPTPSASRTSTAVVSDDGRKGKKPTLSWADKVKGSAGSRTVSDSREPEQTRDANELEKLRKENETLKATIERMASEIAEIKNLALRHAQAPEAMDVSQPVGENSGAAKRRAVDSNQALRSEN
ncbi:hypothetical protein MTO96_004536 [Rhipicephalus appendiculatus]